MVTRLAADCVEVYGRRLGEGRDVAWSWCLTGAVFGLHSDETPELFSLIYDLANSFMNSLQASFRNMQASFNVFLASF